MTLSSLVRVGVGVERVVGFVRGIDEAIVIARPGTVVGVVGAGGVVFDAAPDPIDLVEHIVLVELGGDAGDAVDRLRVVVFDRPRDVLAGAPIVVPVGAGGRGPLLVAGVEIGRA